MPANLDPALLEPIEKVARFIETGDESLLSAFASSGVVIIDNFSPHLFEGEDAVKHWAQEIISWHEPSGELILKHSFGSPQDLRVGDGIAFLSLPTHWEISAGGDNYHEDGGWAFVLVQEHNEWRVRCYGWAVTQGGD